MSRALGRVSGGVLALLCLVLLGAAPAAGRVGRPIALAIGPTAPDSIALPASPSLAALFLHGEGVVAVAFFVGASHVDLALFDLAGRRVSTVTQPRGTPSPEGVLFPGTRDLRGGVYFVRASDGVREVHTRVLARTWAFVRR